MELSMSNGFCELSRCETEEVNGGYTLQQYELVVLGATTVAGIVTSAACPPVGAGIIVLGWAMCAQAEEYGRNK